MINEIYQNQIELAKENVRKNYDAINETWLNYCKTFSPIISTLESKEVILNKFTGFRYLLLDESKKVMEIQNNFSSLYLNEISQNLMHSQPIAEASLQKVD